MRKTSELIWQDAQHQKLFEILDLLKEEAADREVVLRLQACRPFSALSSGV